MIRVYIRASISSPSPLILSASHSLVSESGHLRDWSQNVLLNRDRIEMTVL